MTKTRKPKVDYYFREEGFYDVYDEPTLDSCHSLWTNCLYFTIHEALYASIKCPEDELNKREARSWLLGNTKDFNDVCDMVGYNPETVRSRFKIMLGSNPKKVRRK